MKGKQCYFKAYKALLASLEYIGHNFYPLALQKRNVFRATISTWQHDPLLKMNSLAVFTLEADYLSDANYPTDNNTSLKMKRS